MQAIRADVGDKDEKPPHEVEIAKPFAIGKYEVTFDEYDRFARSTGRARPDDKDWGRERRPVIYASWDDATAYAEWLSEQTGKRYRLPTEGAPGLHANVRASTAAMTAERFVCKCSCHCGAYPWSPSCLVASSCVPRSYCG